MLLDASASWNFTTWLFGFNLLISAQQHIIALSESTYGYIPSFSIRMELQ